MKLRKILIPTFLIFTLIISLVKPIIETIDTSENISENVLRLHILANSDNTYDQDVKLKLKNYILENTSNIFTGKTAAENTKIARENAYIIDRLCDEFLKKQGVEYSATVKVLNEFFTTRVYDDFTLPAGNYDAIRIELGEGKGHNWWCIVFPSVCLSACSTSMEDYMTDEEMELIDSGYTPKFKIIEIYERIKNRINSSK